MSLADENGESEMEELNKESTTPKEEIEIRMSYDFKKTTDDVPAMTDEQLTHMFTTYWGYLMFLNKKQTDAKDQKGLDTVFKSLMEGVNQASETKPEPKKQEKKVFQQLKKRESKALTKMQKKRMEK